MKHSQQERPQGNENFKIPESSSEALPSPEPETKASPESAGLAARVGNYVRERRKKKEIKAEYNLQRGQFYYPEDKLDELKAIKNRKDKKLALKNLREGLVKQEEGLVKMQIAALKEIKKNPDVDRDGLVRIIEKFAKEYGLLVDEQAELYGVTIAKEVADLYLAKHQAVRAARKAHPDDNDLYTYLIGRAPDGRVRIKEGPMTLYIQCEDIHDYARIRTQAFLSGREPTEQELEKSKLSGGVKLARAQQPGLAGCITAENASTSNQFDQGINQDTYIHEEQHAFFGLFKESLYIGAKEPTKDEILEKLKSLKQDLEELEKEDLDPERLADEKELLIKRSLRRLRSAAELRAQDEIMAFVKGHISPLEKGFLGKKAVSSYSDFATISQTLTDGTHEILTKKEEDGGLYDYLKEIKAIANDFENAPEEGSGVPEHSKMIYLKNIDKVFDDQYSHAVKKGLRILLEYISQGHTVEEAIALFGKERLKKWGKVLKRHNIVNGPKYKRVERRKRVGKIGTAVALGAGLASSAIVLDRATGGRIAELITGKRPTAESNAKDFNRRMPGLSRDQVIESGGEIEFSNGMSLQVMSKVVMGNGIVYTVRVAHARPGKNQYVIQDEKITLGSKFHWSPKLTFDSFKEYADEDKLMINSDAYDNKLIVAFIRPIAYEGRKKFELDVDQTVWDIQSGKALSHSTNKVPLEP